MKTRLWTRRASPGSLPLLLALACVFLSAVPLLGGERVLTPQDVARLHSVAEAVISPDGALIAYVLRVPRQPGIDDDGPEWTELHVVAREGPSRPFVTGKLNVSRVAFTPEGREISFLAKRGQDKTTSLYAIPVDGGEARRLLQYETDIKEYSWSPDGKRVAFLAQEPVPAETSKMKEKGFSQEIFEEEWRPVRVWIAELGQGSGKPRALELPGSASELHWSPPEASGRARLAVALAPTALEDDYTLKRKLYVVDADSGKLLAGLENPARLGTVAWSPDGSYLAFISAADLNDPVESRLLAAPTAGGSLRDLLPGYEGHVTAIAWQDSETVMFLGDEGVWTTFNKVGRDGSGRKAILPAGGAILTDFTLSRDGLSGAFIGQSPQHPAEVFFMKHGDAAPRRLTDSNPWLAGMRLSPQEVVEFQAVDGLRLEGILIRPLDEEEGKQYPLILYVHGGPNSHYPNGWLTSYEEPGQVAAARGFAVFYPNYRGSTGRGVEFSKLNQGDFAGKEFDDLMDGLDYLISRGLVDADRVGITGISYGGYAAAWAATYYSEHFAAAVMFAGISDNISNVGTTDVPEDWYLSLHRARPWEDWDLFLERSPIRYVENARTPLLILHGKDDPRVHPSQALDLYRYLKLAGQAPVRLVLYPREEHGNRRAASRLDYNLRLLQWMEHYLKGPGGAPPPYELDYGLEKTEAPAKE